LTPTDAGGRASPGERLLEAIAREEEHLARLEIEQAETLNRLTALRSEWAAIGAEPEIRVHLAQPARASIPETPATKVKLFRSLFRGREDVFPTRFVSKKTGKAGYALACRNKFVPVFASFRGLSAANAPTRHSSHSTMQPSSGISPGAT
jgi:hypothetical protein